MEFIKLRNGIELPVIGLGTDGFWGKRQLIKKGLKQVEIYYYSMKNHVVPLYDSSSAYGYSEKIIGIMSSLLQVRKNSFICTKVSNADQRAGNIRLTLEKSLKSLRTDYIDLYLLHWPQTGTFIDSYLQMEELYREGRVKAIGVCNFNQHHIEELMSVATILPMVNQFEIHPLFTQESLISYCKKLDIQVMAYTPLGRMHDVLMKRKTLRDLTEKYHKSIVQIILRWDIQQGLIPIPRTTNRKHLDEFVNIFDFRLTEKEMQDISALNENIRLRHNPDTCDFLVL